MIAMQYQIVLPSDYDMEIIRKRVRDSGSKTDGFQDLCMKAYLIAEQGKYGNCENQYAPFYLWKHTQGMNRFLLQGPFNNIVNSFGRPHVNNWMVLFSEVCKTQMKLYAVITKKAIERTANLEARYAQEEQQFKKHIQDGHTTYVSAYNPMTWEIYHFVMSPEYDSVQRQANNGLIYDVHHIS